MTDPIDQRVREFLADFWRVRLERLDDQTTLVSLGIAGDDAVDLFEAFGREFDVDLSELDCGKHFGSEGVPLWAPILLFWLPIHFVIRLFALMFRRGEPKERGGLQPVRVADLIEAAKCGKWEE